MTGGTTTMIICLTVMVSVVSHIVFKEEISSSKAELNSWKAATSNEVRVYQDFCDRNLALKKREDELQLNVNKLEAKEIELQKSITRLGQYISELQVNNATNLNQPLQVELSSRTLFFDTQDL